MKPEELVTKLRTAKTTIIECCIEVDKLDSKAASANAVACIVAISRLINTIEISKSKPTK